MSEARMFKWEVVESSNVKALCFQRTGGIEKLSGRRAPVGTLYVSFTNGGLYEYPNVLQQTYRTILNARSVGAALSTLLVAVRSEKGYKKLK